MLGALALAQRVFVDGVESWSNSLLHDLLLEEVELEFQPVFILVYSVERMLQVVGGLGWAWIRIQNVLDLLHTY